MSDFVRMGDHVPINSMAAAASLSMADAQYTNIKRYDTSKVSIGNMLLSSFIGLVAIFGVATALFSMWLEASMISCIAFAFPLITGPCILVQRKRLQWMPTFQDESNRLRLLVNQLATRRMQLSLEVGRMERQIRRMKDIEDRFQQVVRREGKSANEFRQLVRENASIQAEIKKAQAAQDLLDLFSLIMTTDRNEDNVVTSSEAEEFMLRVRAFAGRRGQILNEELILEAFKRSMNNPAHAPCTGSMFNIVQSAMSGENDDNPIDVEKLGAQSASATVAIQEQIVDDGFVKLQKIPRVTATGLVVSESQDDEGNLAHPIKVEDLKTTQANDTILNTTTLLPSPCDEKHQTSGPHGDNLDIVSMILQSFSGGLAAE